MIKNTSASARATKSKVSELKKPPGPNYFPENLKKMVQYARNPFHYFEELQHTYGDIVLSSSLGFHFYILYNPQDIEQVLVKNYRNYLKDPFLRNWKAIFGEGLLTAEGDHWKKERRMVQPAFHSDRIQQYAQAMAEITQKVVQNWSQGSIQPIHKNMMALTQEIVVKTLFGIDLDPALSSKVLAAFDYCTSYFIYTGEPLGYYLSKLPIARKRKFLSSVKALDEVISQIIHARSQQSSDNIDLLGSLLQHREEDGSAFSNQQLRDEVLTLFLAGHETTALALSYTLFLLAQNTSAQEKLRGELAHLGSIPSDKNGISLWIKAVENAPYLKQVIQESLRLYPPAWVMAREAKVADTIGGFEVPAGVNVVIPTWAIHRDARYYQQPEEFLPERWTSEFQAQLPRAAYIPFGYGPRMCIGMGFALTELKIIIAHMINSFQVKLTPQSKLELQGSITARPKHELFLQLVKM